MERHILVADIGGTNPRVAMVKASSLRSFELLLVTQLDAAHPHFAPQLNEFLHQCAHRGWTTDTACFAIAGPIVDNACTALNHAKFIVDGKELVRQTELKRIILINDFEAIGHEMAIADLDDRKLFSPVPRPDGSYAPIDPHGNRAIIGPGTGLGVSYLPHRGSEFDVVASEGGNASAPIHNAFTMTLALHVAKKLGSNRIDTEALVSGNGIRHITDFLLTHPETMRAYIDSDVLLKKQLATVDESVPVSRLRDALLHDVPGTDKDAAAFVAHHARDNIVAAVAMHFFWELFGAAAHDIALHGIATGGLILAGGIPAKNSGALVSGPFMHSFLNGLQPSARDVVGRTPIFISLSYDVSFFGCARKALLTFYKD